MKKISLLLCTLLSISIIGCADDTKINNIDKSQTNVETKQDKIKQVDVKQETKINCSPFFNNVFIKAKSKLGMSFSLGVNFAKTCGYTYIAHNRKDDYDSVFIDIYMSENKQGDKISLIYTYNTRLDQDVLQTVDYLIPDKKKEAYIEQPSEEMRDQRIKYCTHILEQNTNEVDNIEEMEKFLFK